MFDTNATLYMRSYNVYVHPTCVSTGGAPLCNPRHGLKSKRLLILVLLSAAAIFLNSCDTGAPTGQTPVPPTPIALGDGQIDTGKLYHDSRDAFYRSPGGAIVGGTTVTLRLKTAPGDLTSAQVRVWNSNSNSETLLPMSPVADDTWEAKIDTPQAGAPLWYRFIATDGPATAYYNDDQARDGGVGEGKGYESDPTMPWLHMTLCSKRPIGWAMAWSTRFSPIASTTVTHPTTSPRAASFMVAQPRAGNGATSLQAVTTFLVAT